MQLSGTDGFLVRRLPDEGRPCATSAALARLAVQDSAGDGRDGVTVAAGRRARLLVLPVDVGRAPDELADGDELCLITRRRRMNEQLSIQNASCPVHVGHVENRPIKTISRQFHP